MTERMIEVGTAAAVIALTMAVSRCLITHYVGRYPETFVGMVGCFWWGAFGLSITLAIGTYAAAAFMLATNKT